MKNRKNDDLLRFCKVENRIRKATRADTPYSFMLDWVAIWILGSKVDCTLNLANELSPEASLSFVVPQCSVVKLGPRSRPKDDL